MTEIGRDTKKEDSVLVGKRRVNIAPVSEIGEDPKRSLYPEWGENPKTEGANCKKAIILISIKKIRELILGEGHRIDLAREEIAAQKNHVDEKGYETLMSVFTNAICEYNEKAISSFSNI